MRTPPSVVSIGRASTYRPDYRSLASRRLCAAREQAGLDRGAFAEMLAGLLGWGVTEAALARWERGTAPPGDVLLAAASATEGGLLAEPDALLAEVPGGFPAERLAGHWVTCYQFDHHGAMRCHADIATVTAEDRRIRAVNHPPEPRTEGRAHPFRNEIEAELASRHLVGTWKNTSDTRYFGAVQLAVLPGETVMEGYYTGVGSDVEVSGSRWKWVRLETDDAGGITLADPAALYELVTDRSDYDAPLTPDDVREDA